MPSNAFKRWQQAGSFAASLAAVQRTLKRSLAFGGPSSSGTNNSRAQSYLQKLRVGSKHVDSIVRALGTKSTTRAMASEAKQSSDIVVNVQTEAELDKLELWQQGDESLQTQEKMAERQKLR